MKMGKRERTNGSNFTRSREKTAKKIPNPSVKFEIVVQFGCVAQ